MRRGYARNFLIPRGIAVEATSRNSSELQHKVAGIMATKRKLKQEAEERATALKGEEFALTIKIGQSGKSFGAITARDIEALFKSKNINIARKHIILNDAIKTVGEYPIKLKLHSEVLAEILLKVVADQEFLAKSKEEGAASGKGRKSKNRDEAQEQAVDEGQATDTEVDATEEE